MAGIALSAAFAAATCEAAFAADYLTGNETWGGRKAHPTIVNSVTALKDDPNVISLRGAWDFVATPSGNRRNTPSSMAFKGKGSFWEGKPQWGGKIFPVRKLQVPGCWESQFVDDAVTTGRSWFCKWDASPLAIRGYHSGDGWYRRTVTVPTDWKGRRVWLKTGWVNSMGWFWVNGEQVALDWNYCATHKYEITDLVRFGEENMVVVQVNNEAPSHRGCVNSKNHWGGILRDIEIEATPETFIDDAWVRGDFDRRTAVVHIEVDGNVERGLGIRVDVEGQILESPLKESGDHTLEVPIRDFRPWSPEHPNLYLAKIALLRDGRAIHTRVERFGVRKIEVRGREVFLNGRPFYLCGAGWHAIDPINGYAKPDRKAWLALARQIRAAGFNIVRNHTECKMPEYFEACDEAGLMVEAELPYYGDVASDGQRFDPLADAEMLYRHFRRYPSFAIYSFGNEGTFGPYLSARLYREAKARDPDRLVVGQDGGYGPHPTNNRNTSDFAGAPIRVRPRGLYVPDQPFFFHEYVNSSVKLDSRVADRFMGVWAAPISRASRASFLAPFGLDLAWGDRLQDGQNRMQKIYLKYGLESARLDGAACGYCYWSLQDACSPQGGTFIGQALWNPFWGEKRCGSKTADVAVFNSPSCVLMTDGDDPQTYSDNPPMQGDSSGMFLDSTITNLVRSAGQTIRARFHLAHFGEAPLTAGAHLAWRLVADGGEVLRSGGQAIGAQALGGVRFVAATDITVPDIRKPVRARLEATVMDGSFRQSNAWSYWLFPVRPAVDGSHLLCAARFAVALRSRYPGLRAQDESAPVDFSACDTVIAPFGSELERAALAAGRRVVSLANQDGPRNVTLGWWYMTEQMGAALKDHPILAGFPHEGLFEQQFFRIGKTGLALPVEGFSQDDFVMVGEGGKGCYLYLAVAQRPNGACHGLIAGINVLADTPEGTALLDGLLTFAGTRKSIPAK